MKSMRSIKGQNRRSPAPVVAMVVTLAALTAGTADAGDSRHAHIPSGAKGDVPHAPSCRLRLDFEHDARLVLGGLDGRRGAHSGGDARPERGTSLASALAWSVLAADDAAAPRVAGGQELPGADQGAAMASGSSASSTEALAKAAQNPVANLISVPFQYNANFGFGPEDGVQSVLNIQPVIPFTLSKEWNLITRTIVPIIYQPPVVNGGDDEFGLGDITFTTFLSPSNSEGLIWGVGPAFLIPTATSSVLGQGKFGIGPSVVGLYSKGPWVVGALFNNIWSVAGSDSRPDVNQMTLQPFVNYNLPDGWYLTSAPIILANWEADSDDRWTVPIGGGFGRVFHLGKQPLNVSMQGYWNAERPPVTGEWTLRFQVQLLFPR